MKIANKLAVAFTAGVIVVHAGSAFVRVEAARAFFQSDIAHDSEVLGRALGHAVDQAWRTSGEPAAMDIVTHANEKEAGVQIRWVWLDAPTGDATAPLVDRGSLAPIEKGEPVVIRMTTGEGSLVTYVPVPQPTARIGAIEIADPLREETSYLWRSVVSASVSALVLVALCTLIAWVLGSLLLGRPVRQLVAQARAIGHGDLTNRIEPFADDEMGDLANEINLMSDRLMEARQRVESETRSRIEAIEQLRHADRLTSVGTMASGVAHELGTPLNVIEGYAQLIREDPSVSETHRKSAEIIDRQAKRMTQIVRQLLDFARQRGDRLATVTDAKEVVEQTLFMMAPLLRKQGIETMVEMPDVDGAVGLPAHLLQQVLTNVVLNAVHAMPDGGRLEVGVAIQDVIPPGAREPIAAFVISVADTGVGMDPQVIARVFEPFFTTKDVGEGTGLGLSVSYGIVQEHHGWIDVTSTPGAGSRFSIYLRQGGERWMSAS